MPPFYSARRVVWVIVSLIVSLLFAGGFAVGWLLWRSYLLALTPALPVAFVLWIWLGWFGETSDDLNRPLLALLIGFYLLIGFLAWALGAALGMVLNLRRSHPEDPELALGNRSVQRRGDP
jgi:asparagine N-glycosylation enzyme membrane subunit Stt3